jgi:hypothetical protein
VKDDIFYDVDLIKVAIEDDISVAEMKAIVEEAHRQHLKVAVHAVSTASIQTAIDGGADSIEHGNGVTDEQLKTMRDKGIFLDLTPTFYGDFYTKMLEAAIVLSPAFRAANVSADQRDQQRYDSLVQSVLKSGVKFAAGSACRRSTLFAPSPPTPRKCWAGRTVWARLSPGNLLISSRLREIRSRTYPSWSAFAS